MRQEVLKFIKKKYGIVGDNPWTKYPDFLVLRHVDNKKWFGLIVTIPREKLGISGTGNIDIINVKTDPIVIGSFINQPGIFPAYHMNRANWVSVALDGSVKITDIEFLINVSYELTKTKKRK